MIFNTSMVCKGRTEERRTIQKEKGCSCNMYYPDDDKIVSNVTLQNNKLYNKNPFLYSSIQDLPLGTSSITYHGRWSVLFTLINTSKVYRFYLYKI